MKRFVFLSSIRAQSGPTATSALSEDDEPDPTEAYGRSKLAAERALGTLDMDWVALRPVLVYGPGVKGNMAALIALAQSPWPLPLGGLSAERSLLSLENLALAVETVLAAQGPLRRSFVVADPEPMSVAEIVAALRSGLGRNRGLIPVPSWLLRSAAALIQRQEAYERLAGSLIANPEALKAAGSPSARRETDLRDWRKPLGHPLPAGEFRDSFFKHALCACSIIVRDSARQSLEPSTQSDPVRKNRLCRHDAVNADFGTRLFPCEQYFMQPLAGARASDRNFDFSPRLISGQAVHPLGKFINAHWLAHFRT